MVTNMDFAEWLSEIIKTRDMKPVELARLANLDPGVITRVLKAERTATPKTLEAIAHALRIPTEDIFRAAGILPPAKGKLGERQQRLLGLAEAADDDDLDLAIAMLEAALKRRRSPVTQK